MEALGPSEPPAPAKNGKNGNHLVPPMTAELTGIAARLRTGEERYSGLRKKLLVIEQNMLLNHKKVLNEIKSLQSELSEVKRSIQVIEDRVTTIIKELRLTARKEDVGVMKRYIELWNPVKFVTQERVEQLIAEALKEHKR